MRARGLASGLAALAVAGMAGMVGAVPARAAEYGSDVVAGTRLVGGDRMTSRSGAFSLIVQTDGNVVRRPDGRAVWQSGTAGCGEAVFATDLGTIYAASGRVWTTSGGREGVC